MLIYIAEPLFTEGERAYGEKIDRVFRSANFDTYLPHRDAGLFKRGENSSEYFFKNDLERLQQCDAVFAILNGTDVDSGTAWEIGFAYGIGKPVFGILDDTRKPTLDLLNPMIKNSLILIIRSTDELPRVFDKIKEYAAT
jgi:nucleoside 2-deoxyribosyltransferase